VTQKNKFCLPFKTLHFKGKKCALQASIESNSKIGLKNNWFDAAGNKNGCVLHLPFFVYHLPLAIDKC
jgi:hypothetical protein